MNYYIKRSGLTVSEIAKACGMKDRSFFYKESFGTFSKLPLLAAILNVSVDALFTDARMPNTIALVKFEKELNDDSDMMSSFFRFLKQNKTYILGNYIWGEP